MKIGTYYYPEQWPREQWERDFDRYGVPGLRTTRYQIYRQTEVRKAG